MFVVLTVATAIASFGYWFFKYKYPWASYDFIWFQKLLKYNSKLTKYRKEKWFPIDMFETSVDTHKSKTMIIFKNETYSFEYIDKMANKVANLALSLGIQKGDCVAILMYNEPAFVWTWLGFQKIGVETAFLNYNQRKRVLEHSITVCGAKAIFLNRGTELYDAVLDIAQDIKGISLYTFEPPGTSVPPEFKSLSERLSSAADDRPSREHRSHMNFQSATCFIFTSGTTGLPKPAVVTQQKFFTAMHITSYLAVPSTSDDVIYVCLPLYHAAASLMGVGISFYTGSTIVLAEKFSVSRFFKDCCQHKVTIIQYIGELCRYLLNSPKSEYDTKHCIRAAYGNGLRKDVWEDFKNRFQIQQILEFYGATELPFGNVNLFNVTGSIGMFTPFMSKILPAKFIRFDTENEEPFRDESGRCVIAKAGEPGLLIIRLIEEKCPFDGYKNKEDATKRKLLHDVFTKGDVFINSGDLFVCDAEWNMFFYDRLGDSFRWKGENVSTTEVANIIAELPFVHDSFVYGVTVPGCEGKAGMAAINLLETEETPAIEDILNTITKQCLNQLASYAIPRFIRFKTCLDITSTFKPMKVSLKKDGYDPSLVSDPLYYFDIKQHKYCELTTDICKKIETQELNL